MSLFFRNNHRRILVVFCLISSCLGIGGLDISLDIKKQACSEPTEVSLGVDPRDGFATEVKVDIYTPCKVPAWIIRRSKRNPPLIIVACGAIIRKELYSMMATLFAKRNYVVMVLDRAVQLGPGNPFNFAAPIDISNAIEYAKQQTDFAVDTDRIALLGHSFGSGVVVTALNEICVPPFCVGAGPQPVRVPLPTGVKAVVTFGGALFNDQTGEFIEENNNGFPFLILNGSGDEVSFLVKNGEELDIGSFERLDPTKVLVEVENIDHFSINDELLSNEGRQDIPSTLDRQTQVKTVVNILEFWIKRELTSRRSRPNFCRRVTKRGKRQGYDIASCMEEYAKRKY